MTVLVRSGVVRPAAAVALLLAAALVAPAPARAADWLISALEGEAVVIDGARRVAAAAGMRLGPGAIVETNARTAFVRIEGTDQSTYDLGPDTRAMLAPGGFTARDERTPQVYLLQGWLKGTASGPREASGIVTPALEVLPFKASLVVQQQAREHVAFVESGRVDLIERRVGSGSIAVGPGAFYGGEGARRGSVADRPAPAWLKSVPRAFRDPIPLRAAAWRDKRVEPAALAGPTYVHLAHWLSAELTLRTPLPERFAPLVREPDFRAQVVAQMAAHPEWAPVIVAENRARRTPGGKR